MLYMVLESFRSGPEPVYTRFRERGRMAPDGLSYIGSWVTEDGMQCYQVMECADRALLDRWMAAWADLVAFTVLPVLSSADAAARFAPAGSRDTVA